MILIVGLGNPGAEYAKTRHNFGFMVVDALATDYSVTLTHQKKFIAEIAEVTEQAHQGNKVWLAKPQTFMNLSGQSVAAVAHFYKIEPQNIWVIADDLDLPLGKIRVRKGGESGGHHGLESIEQSLASQAFTRIRLGIRGSEIRQDHLDNRIDTSSFVTSTFDPREAPMADRVVQYTVNLLRHALETGDLQNRTHEVDGIDEQVGNQ